MTRLLCYLAASPSPSISAVRKVDRRGGPLKIIQYSLHQTLSLYHGAVIYVQEI
jgi:hypothetical protein